MCVQGGGECRIIRADGRRAVTDKKAFTKRAIGPDQMMGL